VLVWLALSLLPIIKSEIADQPGRQRPVVAGDSGCGMRANAAASVGYRRPTVLDKLEARLLGKVERFAAEAQQVQVVGAEVPPCDRGLPKRL